MLDKREKILISALNALYGGLLPERRCEMLALYYDMDISLSEIAAQFSMSRQGVRDSIKKSEKFLIKTEDKLKLYDKNRRIEKLLSEANTEGTRELAERIAAVIWE